jgi:hypothetical protein
MIDAIAEYIERHHCSHKDITIMELEDEIFKKKQKIYHNTYTKRILELMDSKVVEIKARLSPDPQRYPDQTDFCLKLEGKVISTLGGCLLVKFLKTKDYTQVFENVRFPGDKTPFIIGEFGVISKCIENRIGYMIEFTIDSPIDVPFKPLVRESL